MDPSSSYTGLALVRPAARLEDRLVELHAVRMFGGLDGSARAVRERVYPVLDAWRATYPTLRMCFEESPPTARAEVHHGHQAIIGHRIGWVSGLVAARFIDTNLIPVLPSAWRAHMRQLAADARPAVPKLSLPKPMPRLHVEREGMAFVRVWDDCGHRETYDDFAALHAARPTCRACSAPAASDDARDAWKIEACDFVSARWPEPYRRLVEAARARARDADQGEHELAGVSDACEAVLIALYGLEIPCES